MPTSSSISPSDSADSYFAPVARRSLEAVLKEKAVFERLDYLQELVDALPYVAAVLNPDRQIIFSNHALLTQLGVSSIDVFLGKRFGEAVHCIHAEDMPGGCGTSESCRYCGAIQAIMESQHTRLRQTRECRITVERKNGLESLELMTTATPFFYQEQYYTIFSVVDISHEKRREALERIFFHDIINTAGSLRGFIEILEDYEDLETLKAHLPIARDISHHLLDEILGQRQLIAAERGELQIERHGLDSLAEIDRAKTSIEYHPIAQRRKVEVDAATTSIAFAADPNLLTRILINMLKNALEAIPSGQTVRIGCHLRHEEELVFWVHNPTQMPRKAQLQVFQRSFSTKGANRGLGTYSMRLLGEQYLGGKVYFKSHQEEGTTFFLALPLRQDSKMG